MQTQLDAVLTAADELVGKIYSLTSEDFKTIPSNLDTQDRRTRRENLDLANVLYLFAQFWATVEILRRESIYVRLAESPSGEKLTKFLDCLESRPIRMVVRARQRAIGEMLVVVDREKLRPMGFSEFMTSLSGATELREWIDPSSTASSKQSMVHALNVPPGPNAFCSTLSYYTHSLTISMRPTPRRARVHL